MYVCMSFWQVSITLVTALRKFRINKICYKICSYNAKGGGDDSQRCSTEQIPMILFSVLCLHWFLVAAAEMLLSDLWHRTHECSKYDFTFTSFFVSWNACQIRWGLDLLLNVSWWNKPWGQFGIIPTFIFSIMEVCWGLRGWVFQRRSCESRVGGLTVLFSLLSMQSGKDWGCWLVFVVPTWPRHLYFIISVWTDELYRNAVFGSISFPFSVN